MQARCRSFFRRRAAAVVYSDAACVNKAGNSLSGGVDALVEALQADSVLSGLYEVPVRQRILNL